MHTTSMKSPAFSRASDRDYEIRCVIGASVERAADVGEVLAAVTGVKASDHEAWFLAWHGLGDRASQIARHADQNGHSVSAAEAWLRASTYFGVAVNAISPLADTSQLAPTFAKQLQAWESFVARCGHQVAHLQIPYESTTLPGWLFEPEPSISNGATLVAVNGSDGSHASVWASCTAAALRRGYRVLMFDGPGQQSMLFDAATTFRPDWEHVLTPVYEMLAARQGIEPERIGVYGISQAGYWVPRALAFEHRFAAAIVDPGVVSVADSWLKHLPAHLVRLLEAGRDEKFDQEMTIGMRFSADTARTWRFRARPYGTSGYAETIRAVQTYDLTEVAGQIRTPLLITSPEGEQFWPGQSARLAELAPAVSTLIDFTADEGADQHCQPLARTLTAQRMFDWLDEQMPARDSRS